MPHSENFTFLEVEEARINSKEWRTVKGYVRILPGSLNLSSYVYILLYFGW